jgi:hypothetical protein
MSRVITQHILIQSLELFLLIALHFVDRVFIFSSLRLGKKCLTHDSIRIRNKQIVVVISVDLFHISCANKSEKYFSVFLALINLHNGPGRQQGESRTTHFNHAKKNTSEKMCADDV